MKQKKIEGLGATEVMTRFLWKRKKQLELNLTRENKVEVTQMSIMKLIMDFQSWQIEELNKVEG